MLEQVMSKPISSKADSLEAFPIFGSSFEPKKQETDAAEAEVASLYYQSTISPALSTDEPIKALKVEAKIQVEAPQKSWFGRTKDWLWSLFGITKESKLASMDAQETERELCSSQAFNLDPQLAPPEIRDPKSVSEGNMAKTIAELNQKLVYRLKEISEFEEEMRKTEGSDIDKLLFKQLIYCNLYQKNLKEEGSLVIRDEVNFLHAKNKTIQDEYYDLQDEVNKRKKIHKILHWTGIGLTAGIAGSFAAIYALGGAGAALSGGVSLMSLTKGGTTLSGGILKYKNDLRTGKMVVINQESKTTSKKLTDEISELQNLDEDIGNLIKTIRNHLDNQSLAERASIKRT